MQEIFKPIKNYENKYEISNFGRVKSLINRTSDSPQFLTPYVNKKGYTRVELSQPSKRFLVHRLVAEAFIPNEFNLPIVNHLDNNPSNNHVSNLEWCTQSKNLIHAQSQGRLYSAQKKGGITTSTINKNKAANIAKSMVGTTYHNWTILSYSGLITVGNSTNREHVLCKCSCGTTSNIYYASILKGTASKECTKCSSVTLSSKKKEQLILELSTKTVGTWTNIIPINNTLDTSSRKLKFTGVCVNCGFKTTLTQPSLIGTKILKSCPSLKCKGKDIV